ncbi:MAG TPA: NAD(P)-binding domain-containing protein, partial [Sedimentisphaerales bacterium]
MKIAVIGAGRMGRILAARMATENEVVLYDADINAAKAAAETMQMPAVALLGDLNVDAVVLAVPDSAVKFCIAELLAIDKHWNVFSVATNISREILADMAGTRIRCLNVKIIGHAGEMSRGAKPVIVIDQGNQDMIQLARDVFANVGTVMVGEADQVKQINSVATEEILKAAVLIERVLRSAGIKDPVMIQGALSEVAPGVLRAYVE